MENKILILDIETTGFLNQGGAIVEIGIVELNLDTGEITEIFESLLKEDILTAKHREKPFGWIFDNSDLTIEAIRDAPDAKEIYPEVQRILDLYPLGCTAFNKSFDFGFLKNRGLRITELPCPMILSTNICKLPGQYGGYKWPKVEEAFKHFYPDVEYTEKHRGLDDAEHEAMIVYKLYQDGYFNVEAVEAKETVIDDQTIEPKQLTISVDAITAKVESLVIDTEAAYQATGEFLKNCKKTAKDVEAFYSEELTAAKVKKNAAETERKGIVEKIKLFTDKLDRAERAAKNLMGKFLEDQEAKRRKIDAENRRIEENRRLESAIETGNDMILEKPIAIVKEPEVQKVAGTYSVDVWEFEIVDVTKVNPAFMIPDLKAIGATVRSLKGKAGEILGEGVKVTVRKDIRARV